MTGGSREYVQRLLDDSRFRPLKGHPVHAVERSSSGVTVHAAFGFRKRFDQVVIATHADQALAVISEPTLEERHCLSAFRYGRNRAVIYQDARLMPRRRRLWALQGQQRTWFCGAHFGAGFHEDGLQSGLAVAEQLGGMLRPWDVPDQSGRIQVLPSIYAAELSHLEAAE